MIKSTLFALFLCFIGWNGVVAQEEINNYKYIIVSESFAFQDEANQYDLNALLEFLFNKYGYDAYLNGEPLPDDAASIKCLNLQGDVIKIKGGMFKTKVQIELKDCFGKVIATSKIGESRLKEYKKAYTEAIRNAFETFQYFDYKYSAVEESTTETPKSVTTTSNESNVESPKTKVLTDENIKTAIVASEVNDAAKIGSEVISLKTNELYYAQETSNGYQLVNSEPKSVMILLTTAAENIYIVKGKSAIVFKEDGFWYYSENDGKLGEKKSMNIKF